MLNVFETEHITLEILEEMNHESLRQIGVSAYGHRHKLIKGIEKFVNDKYAHFKSEHGRYLNTSTILIDLLPDDKEYVAVEKEMQITISKHHDSQNSGFFDEYFILRVSCFQNLKLFIISITNLKYYLKLDSKDTKSEIMGALCTQKNGDC